MQPFPEFYASAILLLSYWAVFRASFLVRPATNEKLTALAWLGISCPEVEVECRDARRAAAGDGADLAEESVRVDVEAQRASRRGGDVWQEGAVATLNAFAVPTAPPVVEESPATNLLNILGESRPLPFHWIPFQQISGGHGW
jgi:hypothetical protein